MKRRGLVYTDHFRPRLFRPYFKTQSMTSPSTPEAAVAVSMATDDIALLTMDLPGTGANILNDQLFAELDQAMESLAQRDDLIGVILLSAKPNIFVAGADLNNIVAHLDWSDKEIIRFCERGRAVMARFSRCPFPSVAAIHGACVGGGLELALWCDHRIATDHRRTVLGLPEVKLGLVPGWAGTARLPRIAGLEHAADLVTSGRLVDGAEAKTMGFVDEVVSEDRLVESAIAMIGRTHTSRAFVTDRKSIMGPVPGIDPDDSESAIDTIKSVVETVGERIVSNRDIFLYAPTVVLEHMTRTAATGIKQAWDSESMAMAQVWGSPASRGLLNHFFLVDRNKKSPGLVDLSIQSPVLDAVGIVGAGVMGAAIAETCVAAGQHVRLLDADREVARRVASAMQPAGEKSGGTIEVAESYSDLVDRNLVIESVVETLDVKRLVLEKISAAVPDSTVIASNTSAIPIEQLAAAIAGPERFCGIHFCHPELMSLVEVACGPQSSEPTVAASVNWLRGLRKMPVAINDGPGFVVNRLLATMLDQALRLYKHGISIKQIDHALREFGFLGGPFQIVDVIGVDTCMYAGRTMWEAGLQCVSVSPILPRLMKLGRLGRKKGSGFYQYPEDTPQGQLDPEVDQLLDGYRVPADERLPSMDDKLIVKQILCPMAMEALRIMDEALVADYRDIDLCVIHGFSFPKHRGGILFWADQTGWATVRQTLLHLADQDERWKPSDQVNRLADAHGQVYEIKSGH